MNYQISDWPPGKSVRRQTALPSSPSDDVRLLLKLPDQRTHSEPFGLEPADFVVWSHCPRQIEL